MVYFNWNDPFGAEWGVMKYSGVNIFKVIVESYFQMIFSFKRWLEAEDKFRRRRAFSSHAITQLNDVNSSVHIWPSALGTSPCFNNGSNAILCFV